MSSSLIVGAGALGCEIARQIVLSNWKLEFSRIHLIDMDTISLSNLNRHSLFTEADIGQYKAEIAIKRLHQCYICPNNLTVSLEYTIGNVEEMPLKEIASYDVILCAVDNIKTRRWLNYVVYNLATGKLIEMNYALTTKETSSHFMIPLILIEAGTEGWMGHARLIDLGSSKQMYPCLECNLELYNVSFKDKTNVVDSIPICTLAGIPRTLRHCLAWALSIEWPKKHSVDIDGEEFDSLRKDHKEELYNMVLSKAREHCIDGANKESIMELIDGMNEQTSIIPAIASTTNVIAGLVTLILLFRWHQNISHSSSKDDDNIVVVNVNNENNHNTDYDNYWFYNGQNGAYLEGFSLKVDPSCPFCSQFHLYNTH